MASLAATFAATVRSSWELNVSAAPRYASTNAVSRATPVFSRDCPVLVTLAAILNVLVPQGGFEIVLGFKFRVPEGMEVLQDRRVDDHREALRRVCGLQRCDVAGRRARREGRARYGGEDAAAAREQDPSLSGVAQELPAAEPLLIDAGRSHAPSFVAVEPMPSIRRRPARGSREMGARRPARAVYWAASLSAEVCTRRMLT